MYKLIISILLAGFLLLPCVLLADQGDINWGKLPSSVKSVWGNTNLSGSSLGSSADVFDENENTFYSYAGTYAGGSKLANSELFAEVDFSIAQRINKITATIQSDEVGNAAPHFYTIWVYNNGAWEVVGNGSFNRNTKLTVMHGNLNYTQIAKVKISIFGANSYPSGAAVQYVYELKAFGPPVDIGLRANDGKAIIKIACEPEGLVTSLLRIKKGFTTYGIVLVDVNDVNASRIRIKTTSGVKALRKL